MLLLLLRKRLERKHAPNSLLRRGLRSVNPLLIRASSIGGKLANRICKARARTAPMFRPSKARIPTDEGVRTKPKRESGERRKEEEASRSSCLFSHFCKHPPTFPNKQPTVNSPRVEDGTRGPQMSLEARPVQRGTPPLVAGRHLGASAGQQDDHIRRPGETGEVQRSVVATAGRGVGVRDDRSVAPRCQEGARRVQVAGLGAPMQRGESGLPAGGGNEKRHQAGGCKVSHARFCRFAVRVK